MPLDASTNSIATSGADSNTYASSARDGICDLAKPRAGRATTSGISAFIACVGPSVTRSSPSGRGLHNAATRKTTGKPCAGNPHARFERGRCPLAGDKTSAKGQRLPMTAIRAPRGTTLSCRGWQQEAALRMLMNNLDPEVAERPEDLVVYGGTGRAARSCPAFDAIVAALRALEHDETLLVQSGKPVGVFRTHAR